MTTVTYHVPSISCGHCVHTIERELSDLEGIASVEADQASKQVRVEYGPPADETKIQGLLTEINYPPQSSGP
jgi:copper chaperone CopZ